MLGDLEVVVVVGAVREGGIEVKFTRVLVRVLNVTGGDQELGPSDASFRFFQRWIRRLPIANMVHDMGNFLICELGERALQLRARQLSTIALIDGQKRLAILILVTKVYEASFVYDLEYVEEVGRFFVFL